MEKLKKKNSDIMPVVLSGRKLASTWWGKAWDDNLESYSDYANRMGRGRSYIRHGAIPDLKIVPGKITALVQGSGAKPYVIDITIQQLGKSTWESIIKASEGMSGTLQDMSLTLPPASRQSHISQSTTDSLVLPMPAFSEIVLRICSSRSSVISSLFVGFMFYTFTM